MPDRFSGARMAALAKRVPVRPDVLRPAAVAGRAGEMRLDVGQPDVIRPSISCEARAMAAPIIGAIDQHAAHAGGSHFGKGDLLDRADCPMIPPIGAGGKPHGANAQLGG